ncbi:MAG: GFO IDH MocA protein [Candidatus Magasanikbacteria bacterium]|nr:GFO IDH MocA protein [Candidatus Magasanikbacteria bacterium]
MSLEDRHILVIGGGSIGQRHLRNLRTLGAANLAVVEVKVSKHPELAGLADRIYSSLEETLSENFDVAFICTPTAAHLEQALVCARRDRHLFIEKPVSHNLEGLSALVEEVQSRHLVTMVGSNWKFYPSFIKIKELIDNGAIGKILSARCLFGQYLPDRHPWEDYRQGYAANNALGGGILLDSHEFGYLLWFLGPVQRLFCLAKKVSNLEIDTEDIAAVIMETRSGALAEIHVDYIERVSKYTFEFYGSNGSILWDLASKTVNVFRPNAEVERFPLDHSYDLNQMFIDELRHFFAALDAGQETLTPLQTGLKALELIMTAKESSRNGSIMPVIGVDSKF